EALDREAKVFLDDALDLVVREGTHVVLEAAELGDDVRGQDVGAHREQLAELDEGRTELVEQLAEVLPALRRRALEKFRPVPAARDQVGQLVALEEVAEAVPDGDLGDLRQPAEVALLGRRLRDTAKCSMRARKALSEGLSPRYRRCEGNGLQSRRGRRPC